MSACPNSTVGHNFTLMGVCVYCGTGAFSDETTASVHRTQEELRRPKQMSATQLRAEAAMAFQGKPRTQRWGTIDLGTFQAICAGTEDTASDEEAEWVRKFCAERKLPYVESVKCFMCRGALPPNFPRTRHDECVPSCMYCAQEFDTKEELEAHEEDCM